MCNKMSSYAIDVVVFLLSSWLLCATLTREICADESLQRQENEIKKSVDANQLEATVAKAKSLVEKRQFKELLPLSIQVAEMIRLKYGEKNANYCTALRDVAAVYAALGRIDATVESYKKAVAAAEPVYGTDSTISANWLYELSVILRNAGKNEEALAACSASLRIRKEKLGIDAFETTVSLNDVALLQDNLGNFTEAEKENKRCLEIRRRTLPADHPAIALSLHNLSQTLLQQQKYAEAIPTLTEGIRLWETAYPQDPSSMLHMLECLAFACNFTNAYADARPWYMKAIELSDRLKGRNHVDTASLLLSMANNESLLGNQSQARQFYQRADDIYAQNPTEFASARFQIKKGLAQTAHRDVGSPASVEAVDRFVELAKESTDQSPDHYPAALLYQWCQLELTGQHERAKEAKQKSFSVAADLPAEHSMNYVLAVVNLSHELLAAGKLSIVEELYLNLSPIVTRIAKAQPDSAISLKQLNASVLDAKGDFQGAAKLQAEILRGRTTTSSQDKRGYVDSINARAESLRKIGRYDQAERLYQSALTMVEELEGKESDLYAMVLNNLGLMYEMTGRYVNAEQCMREALEIRAKIFGLKHEMTANSMSTLGQLMTATGRPKRARSLLSKALEIREANLGVDAPKTLITRLGLCNACEVLGEIEEAANLREHNIQSAVRNAINNTLTMTDQEQDTYLINSVHEELIGATSFAYRNRTNPLAIERAANFLINAKGLPLDTIRQRNCLMQRADDQDLKANVAELLRLRKELSLAASTTSEYSSQDKRDAVLAKLVRQEAQLAKSVALSLRSGVSSSNRWITWQEVSQHLATDTVLVDIMYCIRRMEQSSGTEAKDEVVFLAWLIFPKEKAPPVMVELGTVDNLWKVIEQGYEFLYSSLATWDDKQNSDHKPAQVVGNSWLKLSDQFWSPLAEHVSDYHRILLCPSGMTWDVPWAALLTSADAETYVIEKHETAYINSGRECIPMELVVDAKATTTNSRSREKWAVIMTNPKYDASKKEKMDAIGRLFQKPPKFASQPSISYLPKSAFKTVAPVPESGPVATQVKPFLEKHIGGKAHVFVQNHAIETVVKKMSHPAVLFFLTHGYIISDDTTLDSSTDSPSPDQSLDPLLRCGLLLAGCNQRNGFVGDDDGVLTGLEISALDLSATDLVFLGACLGGTGINRKYGQDAVGLKYAFRAAGAQTVISALWVVPVKETCSMSLDYFKYLDKGQSKQESLRSAQLEVIRQQRKETGTTHPFFWGAFTATGL